MNVRNIRGTSNSNRATAWLRLWKEANGIAPSKSIKCAVSGCTAIAEVGAHVIKDYTGMRQFIVPMCREHNLTYDGDLRINSSIAPLPVNP